MTETKSPESGSVPEPGDHEGMHSDAAYNPNQTKLLPALATVGKQDRANSPGAEADDVRLSAGKPRFALSPAGWLKKLSQSQIIWISLSIILTFLVIFVWLIMQGRHKNKMLKPVADEQFEETTEPAGTNTGDVLKNKLVRPPLQPELFLTDDEFAGQAPLVVKANGPVVSVELDPELAAMVDALKKRLQISVDRKTTRRGNVVTLVSKGTFRGFKITVEEIMEDQNSLSEEVTVILPQRGIIKTVNRVLESFRDSDLEQFTLELEKAGLEIITLPPKPEDSVFKVQIRVQNNFGNPIDDDVLISGKSVGKIKLGMTTARLENMLLSSYIILKRKVLVKDIYHDVYKVLDQSNEPLFFVYENNNRVWGISIISENFKTKRGIGIGSSLGSIRINYPKIRMGISEKKIPFVKIDSVDGLFVIQREGVDIVKHLFPSKNKVISILIGNSLEFDS
ncbi:hypothetical protein EH223_09585 [candidate division KSB1 bacterium]|nr:hypothetical protein [Candidatus Aminicenantes bacterium]RQW03634.1 MAG: hypothetical protein EH223_09585 [candidate division KSB1 bacterium]